MEGRVIAVVLRVDVASLVDEPVRHVCVPLEEGEVGNYYLHIKLLVTIIIYRIIYHYYLPVCPSRQARWRAVRSCASRG